MKKTTGETIAALNGRASGAPFRTGPAIEITIDAKGNMVVETVGTTGKQCDLLAGTLEASLGGVESRINKETYDHG